MSNLELQLLATPSEHKRIPIASEIDITSTKAAEDDLKIETHEGASETISLPPIARSSSSPTNANRKKWIFAACVIVMIIFFFSIIYSNKGSLELELELSNAGYLTIRNVGTHLTQLLDVDINERNECKPRTGLFGFEPFKPRDLKVGDFVLLMSPCSIVRVTVRTEAGSETYSFSRR